MSQLRMLVGAAAICLIAACGRAEPLLQAPTSQEARMPSTTEPNGQPAPQTFQATPLAPAAHPSPAAPAIEPAWVALIEAARADLAQRHAVALEAIGVAEVRSVTWPDPGIGCPQPGMAYKQVPVDGLLIRLQIDDRLFSYHSGGGRGPLLCEQATPAGAPDTAPRMDQ